ncbi:cytochrome P450 76T24-like [Cryptomeria japonica]|uniref:cytochrome P450 76T24-like n=1 Tax=Cryptomeria japonica TaxID=3369 RepID=UPI0027DA59ED|nr:cytochrome P450 76T24-like [Cryptomeria japonica]
MVFYTTLNLFGNLIFGANMCDPHDPASAELKNTIWKIMKLVAMPNMADYFPFLRFLDPQGVSCAMTRHLRLLYNFSDAFIQKRLASTSQSVKPDDSEKDFPGVLLDSRSGDFTSLSGIRALVAVSSTEKSFIFYKSLVFLQISNCALWFQELFAAGTETTTTLTIEWAIAEFIRNPQKLNRVRQELNEVVGCNRRLEESVVDRQPYLHAAVKETLRLHPAVPVIVPHEAESSCEIGGFTIPKHSQVVLNVWAIGRDPSVWKNPSEFMPERFLEGENSKIEYSGQNFELIPFGAGRRMCPAIPLASRTIHIVVAS